MAQIIQDIACFIREIGDERRRRNLCPKGESVMYCDKF